MKRLFVIIAAVLPALASAQTGAQVKTYVPVSDQLVSDVNAEFDSIGYRIIGREVWYQEEHNVTGHVDVKCSPEQEIRTMNFVVSAHMYLPESDLRRLKKEEKHNLTFGQTVWDVASDRGLQYEAFVRLVKAACLDLDERPHVALSFWVDSHVRHSIELIHVDSAKFAELKK